MKLALQHVGGEAWIGGIYYLHNLVRALRSLPEDEQPQLLLVLPTAGDEGYYEEITSVVDTLVLANKGDGTSVSVRQRLKLTLARSELVASAGRRLKRVLGRDVNRVLEGALVDRDTTLLFPCIRSMGKTFAIPWLSWAWDFQHKHLPELFSAMRKRNRDHTFAELAADARLIVTSSQDAARDFGQYYPAARDKVRVLHFRTVPVDSWYETDVATVLRKHDLPTRYLALPNQFWVHKNHRVAFEAMRILKESHPDVVLVCTGSTEDFRRPDHFPALTGYIRMHGLEGRIRILGLLPRSEQIAVVRAAAAVVQPSLFEGWSTVVEDARALGKRLLLSDIPVHREQDPPGALYFDPHDPEALARLVAEHWAELRPGPCMDEEQDALERQHELVAQYAKSFLRISRELIVLN